MSYIIVDENGIVRMPDYASNPNIYLSDEIAFQAAEKIVLKDGHALTLYSITPLLKLTREQDKVVVKELRQAGGG